VAGALSPAHLRKLRRRRRRLAESGRLDVRALEPGGNPEPWIRAFLDLERAGWKGRAHTALADDPVHAGFFEEVARAAHARGRLRLVGLFLNDRPLAMKCNLVAPPGAFAWKIAFDETFAHFSPGVLLELDHVAAFHAEPDVAWMDSCTSEAYATHNRVWRERRAIAGTVLSTGRSAAAGWVVSALGPLRRVHRLIRPALHNPKGPASVSPRAARHSAPSSPGGAGIAPAAPPDPAARP
jgi:hypothetical protein